MRSLGGSRRLARWRGVAVVTGLAIAGLLGSAAAASAQSEGWLAVGGGVMTRTSPEPSAGNNHTAALIIRLGRPGEGWGVRYGLNWFSTELARPLDGEPQAFGRLRIRPLLGGIGYGLHRDVVHLSFDVKGGYAFTSFALQPDYVEAAHATGTAYRLRADAGNTFVVKPEVNAWIDLNRRFGVNLSGGYMIARPQLTTWSAAGVARRRIRADMLMLQVGLVYAVF